MCTKIQIWTTFVCKLLVITAYGLRIIVHDKRGLHNIRVMMILTFYKLTQILHYLCKNCYTVYNVLVDVNM